MLAWDGCGWGFEHHGKGFQDIPGFGQIQGHIFANRTHDCRNHCVRKPDCCSFEYREAFQTKIKYDRIGKSFKRRCMIIKEEH